MRRLIDMEYHLISRLIHHFNITHRLVAHLVDTLHINGKRDIRRKFVVLVVGRADLVQYIVARSQVERHNIGSGSDIIYQHLRLVAVEYLQRSARKPIAVCVDLLDFRLRIGDIVIGGVALHIQTAAVCAGNVRRVINRIARLRRRSRWQAE